MEDGVDFIFNEKVIIFSINDFLNVMAEFEITADEELLLLLIYYYQKHDVALYFLKWWTDCGGSKMLEPMVKSLIDKELIAINDTTQFNPVSVILLPRFIEVMNKIEMQKSEWLKRIEAK